MEACLQAHPLLPPFRLLQALLWCFTRMGPGVSVHNTHVVNTVGTVLPDVTDQEVSCMFHVLWQWRAVQIGRTYGPSRLRLRPLHGATCEDEGVVTHVRWGEGFVKQVCDPVPDLVMTLCDEANPLSIEGVKNGEFGVAAVTVIGEVWEL